MAMRGRGGGGGGGGGVAPNRGRSGGVVRPVFEDFRPISEWHQDHESHILTIYLPGFMKEQIRVSTEGENTIRVRGERLVAGNKWSRFQEDFQVPDNGKMHSIRAKFQGGMLNITVPKTNPDKPQENLIPTSDTVVKQPTPNKAQDKVLPAAEHTSQIIKDEKRMEPEKIPDDFQRDVKSIGPSGSLVPTAAERKEISELKEKHTVIKETAGTEEKNLLRRKELLPHEDETSRKMKDGHAGAPKEKLKDKEFFKGKETTHTGDGAGYGALAMGKYKKVVKDLGELNEERQLLVNMGVAVLVIMALSAYVTYKFASGKDRN